MLHDFPPLAEKKVRLREPSSGLLPSEYSRVLKKVKLSAISNQNEADPQSKALTAVIITNADKATMTPTIE